MNQFGGERALSGAGYRAIQTALSMLAEHDARLARLERAAGEESRLPASIFCCGDHLASAGTPSGITTSEVSQGWEVAFRLGDSTTGWWFTNEGAARHFAAGLQACVNTYGG